MPKENSNILLLIGPSGAGKTLYCRHFLTEELHKGVRCISVSTGIARMQFDVLFSNKEYTKLADLVEFINPIDRSISLSDNKNNNKSISGKRLVGPILSDVIHSFETTTRYDGKVATSTEGGMIHDHSGSTRTRLVIDSLTLMLLLIRESVLMQYVMDLTQVLKHFNGSAILTLTTSTNDQSLINNLGSILDVS